MSNQLIDDEALGGSGESFAKRGVDVYIKHNVTKIDFKQKKVYVTGDKINGCVDYDVLVYSPGAKTRKLPIKGLYDFDNVFQLSHAMDAVKIKKFVESKSAKSALVIGAGFIGLETAEAFNHMGLNTTLVEAGSHLFSSLNQELLKPLYDKIEKSGIQMHLDTQITDFTNDGTNVTNVMLSDGKQVKVDLVLSACGIEPNTELFADANYIFDDGKILVDEFLMTKITDVYALGDVIYTKNLVSNKLTYAPFGDVADRQGIILARHIAGKNSTRFKGVLNAFATSFEDLRIAGTGLSLKQAISNGFNAMSTTVTAKTKISSFADSRGGEVEIIYDNETKRILGGLMVGNEAVAQFMDTISMAVYNEMTFDDVFMSDYSYSPTNASVWNPLLAAYRRVMK